jgi:hypothetical protein
MKNYCKCRKPDLDTDDRGNQYCCRCLKPIEMPEPDIDRDYEVQAEMEAEEELRKRGEI